MVERRRSTRAAKQAPGIYEDYTDTEYVESDVYDGEEPTRGIYRLRLVNVQDHFKDESETATGRKWTFRVEDGETNAHGDPVGGWRGSKYTNGQKAKWAEQKIAVALGLIEPNGTLRMSYDQILKKAKPCRALIGRERYTPEDGDPEWRAVLSADFLPDDGSARTKAKSRDADEDEDDDEDGPPPVAKPTRRRKAAEPEPDPEPEPEDGPDLPTEEEIQEYAEELEALELADLKERAKEDHGVTIKRGMKADAIIDAILADVEENGFPEDPEEEPEEEPEPPKARTRRGAARKPASKGGFDEDPPF